MQIHVRPAIFFCLLSLVFVLSCCSRRVRIQSDQVDQIHVWAMAKGIEFCNAQAWEDVVFEGRDTIINNRHFIDSFVVLINGLHPRRKDFVSDKRCVAILKPTGSDSVVVAVGEYGGIHVNDKPMRDDHRVIAFIDKYVYGPHEQDEDYWWPEDIRRIHAYTRRFFEQLDKESQTE